MGADKSSQKQFLNELRRAGARVFALRAFGSRGLARVEVGYYDNLSSLSYGVGRLDGGYATIAVGLNPIDPSVIARGPNRYAPNIKATSASDVLARRFLVVDIDSVRPSGVSATVEELARARELADHIVEVLKSIGWPDPLFILSGNGYHLTYRIDLPVDDGGLVKLVLEGLDLRFSNENAKVDTSLHDPGRVIRLPGTLSCKGESSEDRPHRRSAILSGPESLEVVDARLLEQVASWVPVKPRRSSSAAGRRFSADEVIRAASRQVIAEKDWKGARVHLLDSCPFDAEHNDRAACLIEFGNGKLAFKCHHNSCKGNDFLTLLHRLGLADREDAPKKGTKRVHRSFPQTDTGNAERLREHAVDTLKYLPEQKRFAQWDGRRWSMREDDLALGVTKAVARGIAAEAKRAKSKEERDALEKWAIASESKARRESMLKLYKSEPGAQAETREFDRHPELLNFRNGTLDLGSGRLREHEPADRITKLVPFDWSAGAKAPTFEECLVQILPDAEVRAFLQRFAGYCLSGSVEEQVIVFFVGPGANGKSTILRALQDAMGPEYAIQTSASMLLDRKHEEHPTELADLFSVRLAVASEIEAGHGVNESRVKSLTGGDRIRARRMKKDFFQFDPTHKLVLGVNHLPNVRGQDEGTWRRMVVVPFEQFIPAGERDPALSGKLYLERAGIAAWAVDGYRSWREHGLMLPAAVCAAVESYRLRSDVIARFLAERCALDAGASCRAKALQEAFHQFCVASSVREPAWRDVVAALGRRGLVTKRSKDGNVYRGIRLDPLGSIGRSPEGRGVQGVHASPVSLSVDRELEEPEHPALPTPTPSEGLKKQDCPLPGDPETEVQQ